MLRLVGQPICENIDYELAFEGYNRLLRSAICDVEELCYCKRSLILEACIENLHYKAEEGRRTTVCSRFHLSKQVDSSIRQFDLVCEEVGKHLRVTLQEVLKDLDENHGVPLRQVFRTDIAGIFDLFKEPFEFLGEDRDLGC